MGGGKGAAQTELVECHTTPDTPPRRSLQKTEPKTLPPDHSKKTSGPGCSSLGGGFLSEMGPFFPHAGGRALKANPYAW